MAFCILSHADIMLTRTLPLFVHLEFRGILSQAGRVSQLQWDVTGELGSASEIAS